MQNGQIVGNHNGALHIPKSIWCKAASPEAKSTVRFVDLFCGIGGFHTSLQEVCAERSLKPVCVFSSDIDPECQKAYLANFGKTPVGDITKVNESDVPDHDILLAGFPCQPFSICGGMKGFEDTRGTLFFDIARILQAKRPAAFLLENVKLLVGNNQGRTLNQILRTLHGLGYHVNYRVLNALDFGLPQKRERIFIVGFKEDSPYEWPIGGIPMKALEQILEKNVPSNFYASEHIRRNRLNKLKPTKEITIWHENKAGHISAYPFSCALRAGASYNYLLVNGERRLTPREMLRLQGFPDSFQIVCNYQQTRKQAGNSVSIPVVAHVLRQMLEAMKWGRTNVESSPNEHQMSLFKKKVAR